MAFDPSNPNKYKNQAHEYNSCVQELNNELGAALSELNKVNDTLGITSSGEGDSSLNKDALTLNVIVLGQSGVGKSTLINEILKLKKNRAEEQTNYESMHIKGWAKKYPINKEDTKVKNFNLWDTEGIELSNDNQNNQENHLKKVIQHINDYKTKPNEQINCIWYCTCCAYECQRNYYVSIL